MTQTMDLNKMGLAPLTEFEMQEVEGGGFWENLALWAVEQAIDHWDDLKKGFSAGYHAQI